MDISFSSILGFGEPRFSVWQMAARAFVVYCLTVVMVRLGKKRFMGRLTAFDAVLGIILGSVVSRAITNPVPFFPTIIAGFVLVGLHWLYSALAVQSHRFGRLIKGETRLLVKDGEVIEEALCKSHISHNDLMAALRMEMKTESLDGIQEAYIERNGRISFIPKAKSPRVIAVQVEEGVQTVRIHLD